MEFRLHGAGPLPKCRVGTVRLPPDAFAHPSKFSELRKLGDDTLDGVAEEISAATDADERADVARREEDRNRA